MVAEFFLHFDPDAVSVAIPLGEAPAGMRAGMSLARAGDMSLSRRFELPAREQFLAGLGAAPSRTYAVRQVHSSTVLVIEDHDARALESIEADGMVCARPDALLTITVADCLPIFLVDRSHAAWGLVHSGWKGTGIVREALRVMAGAFGTRPADVSAALGPCIGPCCYRVSHARWEKFRTDFGCRAVVHSDQPDDFRLDLRAANVDLLAQAGVHDVSVASACTCCSTAFGSFRRQGAETFTRMLAFIGHVTGSSS